MPARHRARRVAGAPHAAAAGAGGGGVSVGAITFAHPWALLGLLAAAGAAVLLQKRRRQPPRAGVSSSLAGRSIAPPRRARLSWLPSGLVTSAPLPRPH